jgi:hypothetical protein
MTDEEIEEIKEIQEIKNSTPCIDFINTPVCDSFEINGKINYILY